MGTERFEAIARPFGRYRPTPQTKLPSFKTGGRIPRTGPINAHKGEFVLPKGVKPTPMQMAAVRKRGGKC